MFLSNPIVTDGQIFKGVKSSHLVTSNFKSVPPKAILYFRAIITLNWLGISIVQGLIGKSGSIFVCV